MRNNYYNSTNQLPIVVPIKTKRYIFEIRYILYTFRTGRLL